MAYFRPVVDTWCNATDTGYFTTWTGLTSSLVHKHLHKSLNTVKVHLRLLRQHVWSTSPQPPLTLPPQPIHQPMMTAGILYTENPAQENLICMRLVEVSGQIFSDQTGTLPRVSSRGNRSVMVLYDYGSNDILTKPLKNNTTQELVRDQTRLIQYLIDRGLKPSDFRIDNKCPKALKQIFRENSVEFQLCPPNKHHNNQSDKDIDNWKCHLLEGLSGLEPNLPLHIWCYLLPQATQILNLLRRSRINPRLSAEAQFNGAFNYNRTPMAPPGKKVFIHETPQQRRTWEFHGKEGWYIGTEPLCYRFHHIYIPETRGECTSKTVQTHPPQRRHARYVLRRHGHRRIKVPR